MRRCNPYSEKKYYFCKKEKKNRIKVQDTYMEQKFKKI